MCFLEEVCSQDERPRRWPTEAAGKDNMGPKSKAVTNRQAPSRWLEIRM